MQGNPYTFFSKKISNYSKIQSFNPSITRYTTLVGFYLLVLVCSAAGQQIQIYISADSLRAGDMVTLSLTLSRNQEYDEVIFPDSSYFGQDFELRDRRQYHVSDFKDSLAYQLQFWGVKDAQIQALPVKLVSGADTTTLFTQPVSVTFQSVIKSPKPKLRPLKPIFEFARTWWIYIVVLLLILITAAAIWYYYKKRQGQPEPQPSREFKARPFLDPLRELENNLRQLKTVTQRESIDFKQFYINLGDAIRLYFEQMYNMPALESTSGEILTELNKRAVDSSIIKDTRTVLNEADMVKFAKFKPTIEQAEKALAKAEDFHSTVKKQHQNRVQTMRKQHFERLEQERRAFSEGQKQEETI